MYQTPTNDLDLKGQLTRLRNYAAEYQQWRDLFEMIVHNDVLVMSPNYDQILGLIVALGTKDRERFQNCVLDVFTGIPIDRWDEVVK